MSHDASKPRIPPVTPAGSRGQRVDPTAREAGLDGAAG